MKQNGIEPVPSACSDQRAPRLSQSVLNGLLALLLPVHPSAGRLALPARPAGLRPHPARSIPSSCVVACARVVRVLRSSLWLALSAPPQQQRRRRSAQVTSAHEPAIHAASRRGRREQRSRPRPRRPCLLPPPCGPVLPIGSERRAAVRRRGGAEARRRRGEPHARAAADDHRGARKRADLTSSSRPSSQRCPRIRCDARSYAAATTRWPGWERA